MKIEKINSTNFGYNHQLNKELVQKLESATENREYISRLLETNNFLNRTENTVRQMTKEGKSPLELINIADMLVSFKGIFAEWIDTIFPELHYSQRELKTYQQEMRNKNIRQDDNHWLRNITREIEMSCDPDFDGTSEYITDETAKNLIEKAKSGNIKNMPGAKLVKEYVPTESAKLGFASLGGMKELKKTLNDRIVGMLKDPEQAKIDELEYGKKMPKGFLMYGPPGCGKTTIVEHLSTEANVPLLKLEVGKFGSPYIHETSENIDAAFDYAEAVAKNGKPVLVFVDDADALFGARAQGTDDHHLEELGSFLNRIQKAGENNVVVVAATNRYDMMDEAVRSRFEEQIYVGLPDKEARKSIVKMFMQQRTKGQELAQDEKSLDYISNALDKFPIRAIKMISDKASIEALNDGRRNISTKDFDKIIAQSQNMKVKEQNYKTNTERPPIGFNSPKKEETEVLPAVVKHINC